MIERLEKLIKMHESDPVDPFLTFAIAKEYEQAGDTMIAIQFYLRTLDLDSAYTGVFYHLGKIYETVGNRDLALETYTKGIEIASTKHELHTVAELKNARTDLELDL